MSVSSGLRFCCVFVCGDFCFVIDAPHSLLFGTICALPASAFIFLAVSRPASITRAGVAFASSIRTCAYRAHNSVPILFGMDHCPVWDPFVGLGATSESLVAAWMDFFEGFRGAINGLE